MKYRMSTDSQAKTGDWRDPTQVSSRRSFVLMTMGALAGLGLAGYALFTARGALDPVGAGRRRCGGESASDFAQAISSCSCRPFTAST